MLRVSDEVVPDWPAEVDGEDCVDEPPDCAITGIEHAPATTMAAAIWTFLIACTP
jgi:hypothetical protein